MDNMKVKQLQQFLSGEMYVEAPIFYNNQPNSARLNLEELDDAEARRTVISALQFLFGNQLLWLCAYGYDSENIFYENQLLRKRSEVTVIPFHSRLDPEWFEYDHETIACVETSLDSIMIENYIDYAFKYEFLSNTLYFVNTASRIAVQVYDRRGMDAAILDALLLERFKQKFNRYLM